MVPLIPAEKKENQEKKTLLFRTKVFGQTNIIYHHWTE
jgi:hypothetical protein